MYPSCPCNPWAGGTCLLQHRQQLLQQPHQLLRQRLHRHMHLYNRDCSSRRRRRGACSHWFLAVRTTVSVARGTLLLCVLPVSLCALSKSLLRVLVKPLSRLSSSPQTLSQQLTQFSPTQPLWPAPQSPLRATSQQLSPMLFPGGSPTLGSPVRGSLAVGQVQQVLFAQLPVQQQQLQQQQVHATAQQAGTLKSSSSSKSNRDSSNTKCKHRFSLPHPGHVRGLPSAATSRTECGPTETAPSRPKAPTGHG